MRIGALILTCCLWLLPAYAHADIYSYIDADGAPHFSTQKIDERYHLFLRGEQSFDSASLLPADAAPGKNKVFQALTQHPNLRKYEILLARTAREFAVEPALLKAVMAAESGFNPGAISAKGAIGLMQVMPATAQRYGVQADRRQTIQQKLSDPQTNIRLGARYLHDLQSLFPHQLNLILASYNAGEGAVLKYKSQIPPYPETRNYVQLVTRFYQFYQPMPDKLALGAQSEHGRIYMTIPGRRNMPAAPAAPTTETQ